MTRKQKVELKMSENRGRISEIMALDQAAMTPELKAELKGLVSARSDLETEYRASMIAEGDDEARMQGAFGGGDGQSAEVRALMGRVSIADYLRPAAGGVGIGGAAVELNAALGVEATGKGGGVSIPWAVLAGRPRMAFTDTGDLGGGVAQRPVLQRLFGPGILDALGVRIDSVPVRSQRVAAHHGRRGSGERGRRDGGGGCRGRDVQHGIAQAETTHGPL